MSQRQQGLAPMTGLVGTPYVPAYVVTMHSTFCYAMDCLTYEYYELDQVSSHRINST